MEEYVSGYKLYAFIDKVYSYTHVCMHIHIYTYIYSSLISKFPKVPACVHGENERGRDRETEMRISERLQLKYYFL